MQHLNTWIRQHSALLLALIVAFILAFVPTLEATKVLGDVWRGVPQVYSDEFIYYSHMSEIATGNLFFGNPYFLEHRFDKPLVLFGSSILATIPMFFGVSLGVTLLINFILWGMLFTLLTYWLMRELRAPKLLAAAAGVLAYVQSYDLIFRASVRQEVFPFFLLFYIAFIRFIKNPTRNSIVFLGVSTGLTFYIYGFLWQTAVVTLGLYALYTIFRKDWSRLIVTLKASALGGLIGLPPFLYTLWVTQQPYFWESMDRFGLVNTHIPMMEVVYSGAWVGILLAALAFILLRIKETRTDTSFVTLVLFLAVTGLALWITQGSNLITGKLLETGEHLRRFIVPWLLFGTLLTAQQLYRFRASLGTVTRAITSLILAILVLANIHFALSYVGPFTKVDERSIIWHDQQLYAAPLEWLDSHEKEPVVIWGNPHNYSTMHIPFLTKHYVLYEEAGEFNLMSTAEFHERYLVSQYFDKVNDDYLKADMNTYAGRANTFHHPKTLERAIKICRIIHFYNGGKDCAPVQTPAEVMGDAYFTSLTTEFTTDIKPHIKDYLKKYHVAYILKDKVLDPQYHPEILKATLVYHDERFEIWKLPQ